MTSQPADPALKPRSWWIWGFAFLFFAHAALVLWLGDRSRPRAFASRPEPFVHVATTTDGERRLQERILINEPTLFALPNEYGFSGRAWLNFTFRVEGPSNRIEAPLWLPPRLDDLGEAIATFGNSNRASDRLLLASLRTFAAATFDSPVEPIATASTFSLRGALATRSAVRAPALPSIEHTDLLTNTVVEIGVNGEGVVETVALLGECGSKVVDRSAMRLAQQFQFEPLDLPARERENAAPMRGRIVFTWHITASGTNHSLRAQAP